MKTYLVENHLRDQLAHNLASKNQGILPGVDFRSFSFYFQTQEGLSGNILLYEIYLLLKKQDKKNFPIYNEMFQYPSFIKELSNFASDCIKYKIDPDKLPDSSPRLSELKVLVQLILKMDLKTYHQKDKEEEVLQKLAQSDLTFGPFFPMDQHEQELYQKLIQEYSDVELVEKPNKYQTVYFRKALSLRQELDGALCQIIEKEEPCNIVLCDYKKQFPFLSILLERYGIPYNCLSQSKPSKNAKIFDALVRFSLEPNTQNFQKAISYNAFGKFTTANIYEFFKNHVAFENTFKDHENDIFSDYQKFKCNNFEKDFKHLQARSETANKYYLAIKPNIDTLLQEGSIQEKVEHAYSVFQQVAILKDPEEKRLAQSIKNDLEECILKMESVEDVYYFLECVKQSSASSNHFTNGLITITDITHPVFHQPTTYVLGCNGEKYPNVPVLKGLFDETYVKEIDAYPSLDTRSETYKDALSWIEESGDTIYYSYYTNDYQGRELSYSAELNALHPNNSSEKENESSFPNWTIPCFNPYQKPDPKLTSKDATALFFDNNEHMKSSVTEIEQYFKCPYSYFVGYALEAKKAYIKDLDVATVGNIQHAIMEKLVKDYGKQYAEQEEEVLKTLLQPYFEDLAILFPNLDMELYFTYSRLLKNLRDSLAFLKEYEKKSGFTSTEVEKDLNGYHVNRNLTIVGRVDRIDKTDNDFIIFDYKSSDHSLKEDEIQSGRQLQLFTYLIALKEQLGLNPVGCYYFSLKPQNTDLIAGKMAGRGKQREYKENEQNIQTYESEFFKARKFKGWTAEGTTQGWTAKDTTLGEKFFGKPNNYKLTDYLKVKDCMESIYNTFLSCLRKGQISISPQNKDACKFCPYQSLCRFRGLANDQEIFDEQNE